MIRRIINTDRKLIVGGYIRVAIRIQKERGNGLGGDLPSTVYTEHRVKDAFHIMFEGNGTALTSRWLKDYIKSS